MSRIKKTKDGKVERVIPKSGYTVLVLPDIQFPYVDHKTMESVYDFVNHKDTVKFDEVIQLGDLMDFDYCSRWTKGNYKFLEGKRFLDDYEKANEWLDNFQEVMRGNNKKINFTVLEGNHDKRPKDVIAANPQLQGMIEMNVNLNFEDRDIMFMENWEDKQLYKIGKAHFHHYPRKGSGGKHHAKGVVSRFHINIFYGHLHDVDCFSISNYGKDSTVVGQSLGTLSKYRMGYMGYAPSNWQQAFATFHFQPSGHFNYFVYRIFDHSFITPQGITFGK